VHLAAFWSADQRPCRIAHGVLNYYAKTPIPILQSMQKLQSGQLTIDYSPLFR
jgi:hypothetical protein